MTMLTRVNESTQATKSVIRNAMTIDVEDYFQVSAFAPHISRDSWPSLPCRIERNIEDRKSVV